MSEQRSKKRIAVIIILAFVLPIFLLDVTIFFDFI